MRRRKRIIALGSRRQARNKPRRLGVSRRLKWRQDLERTDAQTKEK